MQPVLAGLSCLLACMLCSLPTPGLAAALDYEALLAGTWQENWDRADVCTEASASFTVRLDRKANTISFDYDKPMQGYDGKMRTQLFWYVREYRPKSLVLALDGETRKGSNGLPLEWEMIFVGHGLYRWRATEWPHREVNRVVGVKCSEAGIPARAR